MVRLARMPSQAIVDGYKGKVDFYVWKKTACARSWPRWSPRESTPPEKANQDAFAYINQVAIDLPVYVIDQYKRMAAGTPLSWKDLLVRSYLTGMDY